MQYCGHFALVQWYDYVCHCLQKPSFRHILNTEIPQFCQRLGAADPAYGIIYYVKLEPLLKSLRTGLEYDSQQLQKDLDIILHWAETWQMLLYREMCNNMMHNITITNQTDYKLKDDIIKKTSQYRYLGIIRDQSMHWLHHITAMCKKANKSSNFSYTSKLK